MTLPSRTPEARRSEYLRNRKPRECINCTNKIELGSKKLLCDDCRKQPPAKCKRCKKTKPLNEFSRDASRPSGYFPWCKECQNESTTGTKFQNEDDELNGHICPVCDTPCRGHKNRRFCSNTCKQKANSLKVSYGLTVEQYRAMVDATGGRCPICRCKPTSWNVDHDHRTGLVTGVVCTPCNVGLLADSKHDIEIVKRLLEYLVFTPAEDLGIVSRAPKNTKSNLHKRWHHRGR